MYEAVETHIKWCNLCNARPADGILEGYLQDDDGQPLIDLGIQVLDACNECVKRFKDKDWY